MLLKLRGDGNPMDLCGDWDSDRLAQVLSNLVGNAVQHGGGGAVTVEANGEGREVVLSVHNDGAPIPPEGQGVALAISRSGIHQVH